MKIKNWILLIINSLVAIVVTIISILFYQEAANVVDNRILQHLYSIKTLKKTQLEILLKSEFDSFDFSTKDTIIKLPKDKYLASGIYDLTNLHPNKLTSVGIVKFKNGKRHFSIIPYQKIKKILLERAGMGTSGESYVVGEDFKLRSQSRFFPNTTPFQITVKTTGVINGLNKEKGTGIFPDYRNIPVYSSYSPLNVSNLNWVILSEIDENEIISPLKEMRLNFLVLTIVSMIVSVILSLLLTRVISTPIKKIHENILLMVKGNYNRQLNLKKSPKDIKEMSIALNDLKNMLSSAVDFSIEIGNMNLNEEFIPKGDYDVLGHSLLKMRSNLALFRNKEQEINLNTKKLLVESLENERSRLAKELHDGIGPLLTTLKFFVQNKISDNSKKEIMKSMIDTTITEIRQMTNILRPATLDKFGLGEALFNYIEDVKMSTKIDINFEDSTKKETSQLNKKQEINIFRIVQELLNNSIKHSKASKIRITLSEFNDYLALYFFDDGIGFDEKKIQKGSGISNIRERTDILKGTVDIFSKEKETVIEIEIPIKPN
jgi:signal transduction histidine kinase